MCVYVVLSVLLVRLFSFVFVCVFVRFFVCLVVGPLVWFSWLWRGLDVWLCLCLFVRLLVCLFVC